MDDKNNKKDKGGANGLAIGVGIGLVIGILLGNNRLHKRTEPMPVF